MYINFKAGSVAISGFVDLKLKIDKSTCWLFYSAIRCISFISLPSSRLFAFGVYIENSAEALPKDDTAISVIRVLHQRTNSQKQQKVWIMWPVFS